jgi:hypothetical protein
MITSITHSGRFQWPRGLRRGSMAARSLGLWVRILPGKWMPLSCECCVLSGRGLRIGLNTLVQSFPLMSVECGVPECDNEALTMRKPWPTRVYFLSYPARKEYAPYNSHLWPVWMYHIFPNYLINGTVWEEKLLNIKYVFRFSLQVLSKIFLVLRIILRETVINVRRSSCKVQIIPLIL